MSDGIVGDSLGVLEQIESLLANIKRLRRGFDYRVYRLSKTKWHHCWVEGPRMRVGTTVPGLTVEELPQWTADALSVFTDATDEMIHELINKIRHCSEGI